MCKYCGKEEKWIYEFEEGQIFEGFIPNDRPDLQIMKQGDQYALNMNDQKDSHFMWNKVINYCFMCGRKLKDE